MKRISWALLSLLVFPAPTSAQEREGPMQVEIRTDLGTIRVELYPDKAPISVSNFMMYVDGRFFDGGSFHRTVHADNQPDDSIRIAVIQGDIASGRRSDRYGAINGSTADGQSLSPPVRILGIDRVAS